MKSKCLSGTCNLVLALVLVGNGARAGETIDDATVFAIFDQANTMDIWTGRLGATRGDSDEVRALGQMVVSDHEAVQQMGRDVAKKLGVVATPPANDSSAQELAQTVAALQAKAGPEFDRAYLRHEMSFHQSVIDALKGNLLPAVKSEEFKALFRKVLPGFERHLAATMAAAQKLGMN